MYTTQDVAELLGFSTEHVRRLIRMGRLPATKVGHRSLRISRKDVEQYLADRRMIGAPVGALGGQRIPAAVVVGHLASKLDFNELFAAFPDLTVEDVQAALTAAAQALAQLPSPSAAPTSARPPTETAGQAFLRLAAIKGTGPADLSARIDDELYGQDS